MDKIPFSVYDFFAYLSSGIVLVATADYLCGLGLANRDVGAVLGTVLLVISYVAGQIVAHFSSYFFEQIVVGRVLGRPSLLLLGEAPRWRVLRIVFPGYHRPLPQNIQKQVLLQAAARNCTAKGEGLFLHAYSLVASDARLQARLDDFRNQYGFARNVAFSFLVSAVGILVMHWYGSGPARLRWAVLAAFAGVTLFYRYLKFFRQYSYELFLRYAELPHPVRL